MPIRLLDTNDGARPAAAAVTEPGQPSDPAAGDQGARPLRRRLEGPAEDRNRRRQGVPDSGQAVLAVRAGDLQVGPHGPRGHTALHRGGEARGQSAGGVLADHGLSREGLALRLSQGQRRVVAGDVQDRRVDGQVSALCFRELRDSADFFFSSILCFAENVRD